MLEKSYVGATSVVLAQRVWRLAYWRVEDAALWWQSAKRESFANSRGSTCGELDVGRFAAAHKAMFGETPLQVLHSAH